MSRRPTLVGRLFLWLLDQAYLHTTEPCRAYGGTMLDGRVRMCDKTRWHWDSHTYAFEYPPPPGRPARLPVLPDGTTEIYQDSGHNLTLSNGTWIKVERAA